VPAPKPIVISHSQLDAIRQCDHKADLAYRQGWTPKVAGPALGIGLKWHEVMHIHYAALQAGSTEHARLAAVVAHLEEDEDFERRELVAWMYAGHVEMWGTDPDWEIVEVEASRLIRLPTGTGRASRFWLRMRLDLLIRERTLGGKLWLVDHKSGRNLPTEKELDLDDQFGLYTWGLRKGGADIFGSVYSAARTQRNKDASTQPLDERYSRTRLYRTDRELETIAREAYAKARSHFLFPSGQAPRAPDTSPIGPHRCRFKCPFTEPCLLGRKAGPAAELQFLGAGGYEQLDEATQLERRGYGPDPQTP
jgi:hypothetical protein